MKILPAGADLFHLDGRTDERRKKWRRKKWCF